jgi:hypothetical protein
MFGMCLDQFQHTHAHTHAQFSRKSPKYKKTAKMPEVCAEGKMKRFLKALEERKSTQKYQENT